MDFIYYYLSFSYEYDVDFIELFKDLKMNFKGDIRGKQHCVSDVKVVSADFCTITYKKTYVCTTKLYLTDDMKIYSNFINIQQDTITLNFTNISDIETSKTSIGFRCYNNMKLIERRGQINVKPPENHKNDLLYYLKTNEPKMFKALKAFIEKQNKISFEINFDTYPEVSINYETNNHYDAFYGLDEEMAIRLVKAFRYLQQNCGAPKQKF